MNEKRMVLALDGQDIVRIVEALVAAGLPVDHIHLSVSELTSRFRDAGVNFDLDKPSPTHICACGRDGGCCRSRRRVEALLGNPVAVHRHVLNRADIFNLIQFFGSIKLFRNLRVSESLMTPELAKTGVAVGSEDMWSVDHGLSFDSDRFLTRPGVETVEGSRQVKCGDLEVEFEAARCGFRLGVSFENRRLKPEILLSLARFLTTLRWVSGLRVDQASFVPDLAALGVLGDLGSGDDRTNLAMYFSEKPFVPRSPRSWVIDQMSLRRRSPLISVNSEQSESGLEFWRVIVRIPHDELLEIKPFRELDY